MYDAVKDAEKISEIIKTRLDPVPEFTVEFHKEAECSHRQAFGVLITKCSL